MSMWKSGVSDLILKEIVSPSLTLIAVAKPWMDGSPSFRISHDDGSAPGLVFSQATGLATGGVQASARDASGALAITSSASRSSKAQRDSPDVRIGYLQAVGAANRSLVRPRGPFDVRGASLVGRMRPINRPRPPELASRSTHLSRAERAGASSRVTRPFFSRSETERG